LFVIDTKREEIAVREANRLGIPIAAVCDTNSDPDRIAYPIPGNDDAIRSITLMTALVAERIAAGRRRFMESQPVTPMTEETPRATHDEGEKSPA
jgi:small subunit ribosomal protein S2